MKSKNDETHVSTTVEVKEMLKSIAKAESRSMRTVLNRLVKKAYKDTFGG